MALMANAKGLCAGHRYAILCHISLTFLVFFMATHLPEMFSFSYRSFDEHARQNVAKIRGRFIQQVSDQNLSFWLPSILAIAML